MMTKYVIYYMESETNKKYVETIYRNSISSDTDKGDAIEFEDKDTALKVRDMLNKREQKNRYKVMGIVTKVEEDIDYDTTTSK